MTRKEAGQGDSIAGGVRGRGEKTWLLLIGLFVGEKKGKRVSGTVSSGT